MATTIFLCLAILVSLLGVGLAKVLNQKKRFDNNNCGRFLYRGFEPNGLHRDKTIARICQCYQGADYFATMYDRNRRIALYSAYVYGTQPAGGRGQNLCGAGIVNDTYTCGRARWCIEPELIAENIAQRNMEECPGNTQKQWLDKVKGSQAVDQDYSDTLYTRAHLNPNGHNTVTDAKAATFTLTNAVPQIQALNKLWAEQYENNMQYFINSVAYGQCPSAYVLTGAIPSNNKMNERVTIPSSIWSAFCCVNNGNPTGSMAFWLENDPNVTDIEIMTLRALQNKLGRRLKAQVTLFQNDCEMPA
ncbi:UNVERIFIED_CONTAM: hypothetical protein FKN15_063162 [Acipenser sinensis]